MKGIVFIRITIFLSVICLSRGSLIYSQRLTDTLKISAVEIFAGRTLNETGMVKTKLDSVVLKEKANTSLAEVLAEHSHVFIKTYGRGAMASASFRGTAPSHTRVTWNGIELNSPLLGMADFSLIPMFFVDDIELYHGSSSLSRTPGALGGLISLSTTPDRDDNFRCTVQLGSGSFGSYDGYIKAEAGSKYFRSGTRLFYAHSDNDYRFLNSDIVDSINLETGEKYHPVMRNRDAWFSNYGLLQEFHFRPGEKDFLNLSIWGQESSRSIPQLTTNESGLNNNINRDNTKIFRGVISYKRYMSGRQMKVFSGFSYTDDLYTLDNRLQDSVILNEINSKSHSMSIYNHLEYSREKGGTNLIFSAGFNIYDVNSYESVRNSGYEKGMIQSSLMANLSRRWNNKIKSNFILVAELVNRELLPLCFNSGIEYHILPKDQLYLRAGVAGNSKYPSLNDLYYQPGGNPSLKSEKGISQEIGLHYSRKKRRISWESEISAYNSRVSNWIIWLPTFKGYWVPGNIDLVNSRGIETNFSISGDEGIIRYKLKAMYSLTRSVNYGHSENPADMSYGHQLPFIPVHSGNCFLILMFRTWNMSYLWNYYSQRYTTTSNQLNTTRDYLYPYFMNQAGIGKQLNRDRFKMELNLKIHNLFNERYRSVLQRPMPGRNYSLQAKFIF